MEPIIDEMVASVQEGNNDKIKESQVKLIKKFLEKPELSQENNWIQKISSKFLTKMLSFLENEDKKFRQLTLMAFLILLHNDQAKIEFMDRCGLPLKSGKLLINRVKNLRSI